MENQNNLNEPLRLKKFAIFFKNYMSIWTIIIAALPIPTTMLDFIPTYTAHTKIFSVYTSLICFLLLGFIFYRRHKLGALMFGEFVRLRNGQNLGNRFIDWLPGTLIVLCLLSILGYHISLNKSINTIRKIPSEMAQYEMAIEILKNSYNPSNNKFEIANTDSLMNRVHKWKDKLEPDRFDYDSYSEYALKTSDLSSIPYQWFLIGFYFAIFIFAEAAFIIMALKEYLQDLLGLKDELLITSYFIGEKETKNDD